MARPLPPSRLLLLCAAASCAALLHNRATQAASSNSRHAILLRTMASRHALPSRARCSPAEIAADPADARLWIRCQQCSMPADRQCCLMLNQDVLLQQVGSSIVDDGMQRHQLRTASCDCAKLTSLAPARYIMPTSRNRRAKRHCLYVLSASRIASRQKDSSINARP